MLLAYALLVLFALTAAMLLANLAGVLGARGQLVRSLLVLLVLELVGAALAFYAARPAVLGPEAARSEPAPLVPPNYERYEWSGFAVALTEPRFGWVRETKALGADEGTLELKATGETTTTIRLHYRPRTGRHTDNWDGLVQDVRAAEQQRMGAHGAVTSAVLYVGGLRSLRIDGKVESGGTERQDVTLVYVPAGPRNVLVLRYARNEEGHDETLNETFRVVLSSLIVGERVPAP